MTELAEMVTELEGIEKGCAKLRPVWEKYEALQKRAGELRVQLRERLALGRTGGHAAQHGQMEDVRAYLRERPDSPHEVKDIATAVAQRPSHVSARCSALVGKGEARKVARGYYQWAGQ